MKKIVALVLSMVMVLGLATTAFAAVSGENLTAALANETSTAVMQDLAPQVDAAKTFATFGLLETDVVTKTVVSKGPFVKVPSALNANYVFVNGTEIVYLNSTFAAGAKWDKVAEAVKVGFNNALLAKCGELYVESEAAAAVTYYLYDDEYYVEATPGVDATITFNVDGVAVWAKATTAVIEKDHAYKYDTVQTNATTAAKAVSKVYCSACGTEFAFVDGSEAMAVAKFGAGNYTDTEIAGYFPNGSIYVGTAVASAPVAGDKVESAQTFDAGIAMYVGMSVMAAAGSAVVLKKKD